MHRDNRPGFIGDGGFDERFVDIHRIATDINEDDFRPAQHKGVGGGDKGIAGIITSSPGWISSSSAAISSEAVQEGVSSAFAVPNRCSIHCWQRRVKPPSPHSLPLFIADCM